MQSQDVSLPTAEKIAKKNPTGAHRAAGFAAAAALGLALGKLGLFWLTGSMVVALSAWDSAIDVLVSFANHKVILFARQEADTEHPYGHGKAESIAALAQGALIFGGAIVILFSSVGKIVGYAYGVEETVTHTWPNAVFFLATASISAVVTIGLSREGKKHNSPALLADSEHYRVDVVSNLISALAIGVIVLTHIAWLDATVAAFLAFYLGAGGFKLLKQSVDELMDRDVSESIKNQAIEIIKNTSPRVIDVHKFRGRKSGHKYLFDCHVTLPVEMTFSEAHIMTELIEENLQNEFDADVVVHTDPG